MVAATPTIRRRLTVMVYESMLLFGVLFCAVALFLIATRGRDPMSTPGAFQAWCFIVLGGYFIYAWCKNGQTLAMQTWRIRLVSADGSRVKPYRALLRYVLAWLWFTPGWAVAHAAGLGKWPMAGAVAANVVLWALLAYADKERQFLHDRLAGTRIIGVQMPATA